MRLQVAMIAGESVVVPCTAWRSGHVGNITMSCALGVTSIASNTCVAIDHCDAGSDDCRGPAGFESNHTCIPTGAVSTQAVSHTT